MPELEPITSELQQLLTAEQAWHYHVIPKAIHKDHIEFYTDNVSFSKENHEALEILTGKSIKISPVESEKIQKFLGTYYRRTNGEQKETRAEVLNEKAEDFLQNLIREAKNLGSSDIHLECYESKCRVRIRIDGVLIERYQIKKTDYPALINKIKIQSNLDIAEKRLPQDGRIFINSVAGKFDIRVSVLPTLFGEKIVLRLLSNDQNVSEITELGFSDKEYQDYSEAIKKPHGIILISGPTGSGKTTTLYATLKILNKEKTNILTIEDPIEFTLPGVNQVQLKESIGLTFASALRTFLRQDPDIIMLGEIRDSETAQMAIRTALTGHLVLSTIHTNSAWETISRLKYLEIPPYLISSTLNISIAQRLLRLLCKECKEKISFDEKLYPQNFKPLAQINEHFISKGCQHCYFTGYKGRTAIFEVIPIDSVFADLITKNTDIGESIPTLLKERGIKTLLQSAFQLFANGDTSIDEVYPILLNTY